MCQLLGMNANTPTDICFSFTGFQKRGGATDVHADGWGIAFFEKKGVRLFLDPQPSAQSPVAELVRNYPIHSLNVIAHIRKATQGSVSLENTHPFMRELWGRYWIFAHNGNLLQFDPPLSGQFLPVGDTDSEKVFCWLLDQLQKKFGKNQPDDGLLFEELHTLTLRVAALGASNFLLSNGQFLFAHCSTDLAYIIRRAPFNVAHLKDEDMSIDFNSVTTPNDRVAIIATQPLTDNEKWEVMVRGSLYLFKDGEVVGRRITVPGPLKNSETGN